MSGVVCASQATPIDLNVNGDGDGYVSSDLLNLFAHNRYLAVFLT